MAYVGLRPSTGPRLDRAVSDAVSNPAVLLNRLNAGRVSWTPTGPVDRQMLAHVSLAILVLSLVCLTLALVRRRLDLLLGAVVVIGGANFTTQILQY